MQAPLLRVSSALALVASSLVLLVACDGDDDGGGAGAGGNNGGENNDVFVGDNNVPAGATDPGRVTIHRLNRAEYNNTVRELFGTSLRPADDFPAEDHGYGFDNIADVLSVSDTHIELYQRAADQLITEALHIPREEPDHFIHEAEELEGPVGGVYRDSGWNLWSNGSIGPTIELTDGGRYRVSVRAFGQQAGPDPARMAITVNGIAIGQFDVTATADAPGTYSAEVEVEAGQVTFEAEFLNDFYDPDVSGDRNLIIDRIEVEGPLDLEPGGNPLRERLVTCDPAEGEGCAEEILGGFAARAWRRPLVEGELTGLMDLYRAGAEGDGGFDGGLATALEGVLVSSHFIFRVEIDPQPTDTEPHLVSNYELAARLSYFLWSSMPDDQLFALAEAGMLHDPAVLEAQVDRMIDDPRSDALVANFGGQWLYTRALVDVQPDYQFFPDFDEELRSAMRTETELFFREFLHQDLGLDELFTARFSYINDRLARHYGMPAPGSDTHVRVELDGQQRRGLLTQGAILTVTSYPTRTSPVKRGKWVLTQLLCSKPPDPPPGVEGLITEEVPTGSLRERLEAHRVDPDCAVCHQLMDPVGFALEHYDGVGAWRDKDRGGFDIDDTGTLPGVGDFEGASELADILATNEEFPECVTEQLFTYALGRGPTADDDPWLEDIAAGFVADDFRLRALIKRIVLSEPFRYRRGQDPSEDSATDTGE